jgi:predicted dehydrogenase
MRVAIVGCGLIGQKRIRNLGNSQVVVCCDRIAERANAIAKQCAGAEASTDWQKAVARPDVEIVIAATSHDMLAAVAEFAADRGKHVFAEKPGARRASELERAAAAAKRNAVAVRIGFNHRYHRAFRQARQIFDSGALGPPMYVRARYGHGGRIGYESEWRAAPEVSGGGEAIDQGIHLIDLARWFLGDFSSVQGHFGTYFWNMPVEDNAFFLLRTAEGRAAFLHASWTEWKNLFSFELFCRMGKLEVSGLGGSYGVERLACYQMSATMGPPQTTIYEYPMEDDSWRCEFAEFLEDIGLHREPRPGIADAQSALRIIERIYQEQPS